MPELVSGDKQDYKAVKYSELPLLTIQVVPELKAETDALQARVEQLEKLVNARLGAEVSEIVMSAK